MGTSGVVPSSRTAMVAPVSLPSQQHSKGSWANFTCRNVFPRQHSGLPCIWSVIVRSHEPCSTDRMDSLDGFIGTYSGIRFWPLLPNPDDILIADIAHALAHQCRFGGHASKFYSVPQPSLPGNQLCSPEHALWGLLHDASEA